MLKNGTNGAELVEDNAKNGNSETLILNENQNNIQNLVDIKVGFTRQITLLGAIGLLVGTVVGSGIFVSPSVVANHSGSSGLILIIWAASGVLALFSALCYVELGTMFPTSSGSDYSFVYEGFGDLPAFVSGFTNVVLLSPMALVMVALTCASYIVLAAKIEETYIKIIAAVIIGVIFILNCASVNLGTIVQEIFTAIKILALLMIAITGVVRLFQGDYQNFRNFFKGSKTNISEICYAFYGGFWAYGGYSSLPTIAAELKNPIRDLPLAMWIGMILVTVFYLSVNAAYLTVMTPLEIATSNAVGVTFGNQVYGSAALVIPVLVACSSFGASNGTLISSSRMLNAVAQKGHVPKFLSLIHKKRHTPSISLFFICIISLIMLIPESSNFENLLKYISFINAALVGLTMSALLWLRYKRPDIERPFKVFLGLPILVLLSSAYFTVAPFFEHPLKSTYCLIAILVTIPIYYIFIKYKKIPKFVSNCFGSFASMLEKLNMGYPTEELKEKIYFKRSAKEEMNMQPKREANYFSYCHEQLFEFEL
ncbi:b(0,+)-type amino acid transporter 1 [Hydra vulgaris]|uniref:b(0,+)-type amino acid transporter 1 n=1 Tax=Hydra vulgaris TaxID=6087 RepID=UPI001F5EBAD8|nr:b(0,+)-type amino acid transporter 1-like [Hydra vulgaris]